MTLKNGQISTKSKGVKLKVNPFTFWHFRNYFQSKFFWQLYVQWRLEPSKLRFKAKIRFYEPFWDNLKNGPKSSKVKVTFWQNLFGTFFKVNIPEKYTSKEAQTKLKTLFKPYRFWPFIFWRNVAIFWDFFQIQFPPEIFVG